MTLQPRELKLAAKLLDLASDQFSNHGCNDFDLVKDGGLTPEEAYQVNRDYVHFNGDSHDWEDEELRVTHAVSGDDGVMAFLAKRFKDESDSH